MPSTFRYFDSLRYCCMPCARCLDPRLPFLAASLRDFAFAGKVACLGCLCAWLCLTVLVQVLYSCRPTVTISGLMNAQTASGSIEVTSGSAVAPATFSRESGTLVLNLTSLFSAEEALLSNNKTQDSYKTTFLFRFNLENPANPQHLNTPSIHGEISLGSTLQQTSPSSILAFTDIFLRQRFGNSSQLLTSLKGPSGSQKWLPLFVSTLDFTTRRIRQSTPYPCVDNKIVVDLRSNIDLVPSCQFSLTLTGLTHALTPDNSALGISTENSTASILNPEGVWTQTPGTLEVNVTALMSHNTDYSFGFFLVNPYQNRGRAQISIHAANKGSSASVTPFGSNILYLDMSESEADAPASIYKSSTEYSGDLEAWPLYVRNLKFEIKTIRQSTPHAGCRNSITVSLQTNVPLTPNAYCQPRITISGFKSANHTSGKIGLVALSGSCPDGGNAAFVFQHAREGLPGFGTWFNGSSECAGGQQADSSTACQNAADPAQQQHQGHLELWSAQQTQPGTPYSFSFYIRNPLVSDGTGIDPLEFDETGIDPQGSPTINIQSLGPSGGEAKFGVPSFVNAASQQESMDRSQDRPCCLCDVNEKEASPLVVKAPVFCKKRIGQSSPYPCTNNTLTVTISATTQLYANFSVITISGLAGAEAPTGPLKLFDNSGGQDHDQIFAPAIGGQAGYGSWDNVDKALTLHVVQDIECSGEYFFSFTVRNQNSKQAARDVSIAASRLHLYHPTSVIKPTVMTPDLVTQPVARGRAGDAAPLFIWEPIFTVKTIVQNSSVPCDHNVISVSLRSSVPLFPACSPVVTISGLTGSDSPSNPRRYWTQYSSCAGINCSQAQPCPQGHFCNFQSGSHGLCEPCFNCTDKQDRSLEPTRSTSALCNACGLATAGVADCANQCNANLHSTISYAQINHLNCSSGSTILQGMPISALGDAFPFENVGDWNMALGTLKLRIISSTIETDVLSFSFSLKNPSRNPIPAVNSVQVRADGIVFPTVMMDLVNSSTYSALSSDPVSRLYPLFIDMPSFTVSKIGQDSPWPCDLNTIHVSLVSSTLLLRECSPTITIMGITGMRTPSSIVNNFTVNDHGAGSTRTGVWSQGAGTLELDVSDFGDAVQSFNLSFVLRNPAAARQALSVSIKGMMFSAIHTSVRQFMTPPCSVAQNVQCADTSEPMINLNQRDQDIIAFYAPNSTAGPPLINAAHGIRRGNGTYEELQREVADNGQYPNGRTRDDDVGRVREIVFLTNRIVQSAASGNGYSGNHRPTDPCSPITITVTLSTSVPLITSCQPRLTISGLTNTPYFNDTRTNETIGDVIPREASNVLMYVAGSWSEASGSWEMRVAADTMAGRDYVIAFNLLQKAAADSDGVTEMMATSSGIVATAGFLTNLPPSQDPARPLRVNSPQFHRKYISQSSPFPCDNNTISVTLSTGSDSLFQICDPNVTISGLTGSLTPDLAALPLTFANMTATGASHGTSGAWTQSGSLIFRLPFASGEKSRSQWSLSFELVNPKTQTALPAPHVSAEFMDYKGVSEVKIDTSLLIRDVRKFDLQSFVCNTTYVNVSGVMTVSNPIETWGHGDDIASIPTTENTAVYKYLCGQFPHYLALEEPRSGQDQDRMPLRVRPTAFITKDIGQNTPYPCDTNRISVTLSTTVPLLVNNKYAGIDCQPSVTITGLTGSQSPDTNPMPLVDFSADQLSVSSARWTHQPGSLVVNITKVPGIRIIAAQNFTFKFDVTNKATPQTSPAVYASTSLHSSGVETMHRDGRALQNVWEMPLRTAEPLFILAARFTTKKVGQSVPYPGCLNTITITIASNVPLFLHCPTRIRLSGFTDESTAQGGVNGVRHVRDSAPLTPFASGPLSLTGFQHLEHDQSSWATAQNMWWSPGICHVNDTLGTHFFMDSCEPDTDPGMSQCRPGNEGFALWENGYVATTPGTVPEPITGHGGDASNAYSLATGQCSQGTGYTSGKPGVFSISKRLTMWLARNTAANQRLVFQFQLQNPLKRQLSPEIYAEGRLGDNSALQGQQYFWDTNRPKGDTTKREGNVISALAGCPETHKEATVAMDKDATTLLCCTSCSFAQVCDPCLAPQL